MFDVQLSKRVCLKWNVTHQQKVFYAALVLTFNNSRVYCYCAIKKWIISNSTYGCNHSSSEEEGTAHIPEAGIVGCVSNRTHSGTHSIHGVLERAQCMNYSHHNSQTQISKLTIACQLSWQQQTHVSWWPEESEHVNPTACQCLCVAVKQVSVMGVHAWTPLMMIVQHSWG